MNFRYADKDNKCFMIIMSIPESPDNPKYFNVWEKCQILSNHLHCKY